MKRKIVRDVNLEKCNDFAQRILLYPTDKIGNFVEVYKTLIKSTIIVPIRILPSSQFRQFSE